MVNGKKKTALTGAIVAGLSLASTNAFAAPEWTKSLSKVEKCAGVAQKGKNDCGTKSHNCGGKAKADNLPDEWVYTPVGVCDKIGGNVIKVKEIKG